MAPLDDAARHPARLRRPISTLARSPAGDRGSARGARPSQAPLRPDARRGDRQVARPSTTSSACSAAATRRSSRSSRMPWTARRTYRTGARRPRRRHAGRRRRASPRRLEKALAELAMAGTRCELALHADRAGGRVGTDGHRSAGAAASRRTSAKTCARSARIASGGELSRVMLAIKTLASTDVPGKTLIFDEVDAGIGGAVARRRGRPAARALGRLPGALHHPSAAGRRVRRRALPGVQAGGRRPDGDARRAPRRASARVDGSRPYDGRAGGVTPASAPGPAISARRTSEAKGESGPEGERRKSPL